nr:host cell division inhibitor Icd-like protein [Cedecea sp. NFIX57]
MAYQHSTQTRPSFTWLFLGTRENDRCLPTLLRTQATTEAEAREAFPDWNLTFAAKIRTDRQLVTPWTDPDAKMIWAVMAIDVSDFSPSASLPAQGVCNA